MHAFLLDQKVELLPLKQGYGSIIFYLEDQDPFDTYISENMQYTFKSKVYQQCGSRAVDGKRILESNASSILGTLTLPKIGS